MINLNYELWPIWTDWLEEQEQETALLKFFLTYPFMASFWYGCGIISDDIEEYSAGIFYFLKGFNSKNRSFGFGYNINNYSAAWEGAKGNGVTNDNFNYGENRYLV